MEVKKVSRIERAVAQELVSASMKLVCPRARNGVDDSTGCLAVFGGVIARQNREFLNGIHAQIPAQHTAGPTIRIIIEADAIEAIVILLRASTGDRLTVLQSRGSRVSAYGDGTCV